MNSAFWWSLEFLPSTVKYGSSERSAWTSRGSFVSTIEKAIGIKILERSPAETSELVSIQNLYNSYISFHKARLFVHARSVMLIRSSIIDLASSLVYLPIKTSSAQSSL